MRNYIGLLVLGLVLSGCSAAGTPAETPDGTDSSAAESGETTTVNAPPSDTEEDSTETASQPVEPPKTCLVSREVPRSEFKEHEGDPILYADDDLVVTYREGSLVWSKDNVTGFVYANPLNPDDYDDMAAGDWPGTKLGWHALSDGRFVVYDTCDEPNSCPHFFVWDADVPEKPAVEFATAPMGKSLGQAHPSLRAGQLLWSHPATDSDEYQIMLRDLATGERQILAQGDYQQVAFAGDDLVLFTKPGETARTLAGTYISSDKEWQVPAALQDFHLSDVGGFVSDGATTAVAYGPLTSGDYRGYGVAVWREGWTHALVDESYGQVTLGEDPADVELHGDLLTYRLRPETDSGEEGGDSIRVWNLRTGVIYEVYTEYGVPSFDGDDLVISTNVNKTPGGESARIPLAEFEAGEC